MPIVLTDSTTLGVLCNPQNHRTPVECRTWANQLVQAGVIVVIPGVADYEIRRELVYQGLTESIKCLDKLRSSFLFLPIDDKVMKRACDLWAWARRTNQSTAGRDAFDGDVILAAQAVLLGETYGEYVLVATDNINHIQRYTPARSWRSITVECCFNPSIAVVAAAQITP